jgi:hypothetical protein
MEQKPTEKMTEQELAEEINFLIDNDLVEYSDKFVPLLSKSAGLLGRKLVYHKKHGELYTLLSYDSLSLKHMAQLPKCLIESHLDINMDNIDFMTPALDLIMKTTLTETQINIINGDQPYLENEYARNVYPYILKYRVRKRAEESTMKMLLGKKDTQFKRRFPILYKQYVIGEMFKLIKDADCSLARHTKKLLLLLDDAYVNDVVYTKISKESRTEIINAFRNNEIISKKALQEVSDVLYLNGRKSYEEMINSRKEK